jgi:hypothetical protein
MCFCPLRSTESRGPVPLNSAWARHAAAQVIVGIYFDITLREFTGGAAGHERVEVGAIKVPSNGIFHNVFVGWHQQRIETI